MKKNIARFVKASTAITLRVSITGLANAVMAANVVFQLDANKHFSATESNITWQALQPQISITGNSADWMMDGGEVVNIKGSEAGAMVFSGEDVTNKWVKTIVMAVRCASEEGGIFNRETLVCGRRIFRVGGRPFNSAAAGEGNAVAKIERGGFCEVAWWKINGVAFAPLVAGETCIVEVTFKQPFGLKLSEVGLGADLGREEWGRGWRGSWLDCIGFEHEPSALALSGVRSYLNLKNKIGLQSETTQAAISAARAEGVRLGSYFATLFLVY